MAVANPVLSATNSRIIDMGVGCGASTSPTTLPKSKLSSASNFSASCCMRRFSTRQVMCSSLICRLRAASSVRSSKAVPAPWLCQARFDAERRLGVAAGAERAQLGRAAHGAVDKETMDYRVRERRRLRILADEFVRNRAAEPVTPAFGIETQQIFAIKLPFADPQLADGAVIDQGLMHQGLQTLDEDPPGGFLSRPATEPSNRCNSHVMLRCSKNYDKGPHILVIPAA